MPLQNMFPNYGWIYVRPVYIIHQLFTIFCIRLASDDAVIGRLVTIVYFKTRTGLPKTKDGLVD